MFIAGVSGLMQDCRIQNPPYFAFVTIGTFFFKYLLVSFKQGSAADGPRGLSVGDIVTGLEDCAVRGVEDWSSCLFHLSHTPQTGYCVPVASLQPSWAHGRGGCEGAVTVILFDILLCTLKNKIRSNQVMI